jgi:hypothetical protein
MNDEISLENIMAKLDRIESLLAGVQIVPSATPSSLPASFLPGGKDWFLMATEEERRVFNRKRGYNSRRKKQ